MLETAASNASTHSNFTFWLDVADKVIKFLAVLIGAAWTWMNFRRSRTYAQKLELQLSGSLFYKDALYFEISAGLKNLGAARHIVQQRGTVCEVVAIMKDLSEVPVKFFSVFESHDWIEPAESIGDSFQCLVELSPQDIVWLKTSLRVVSNQVEWNASYILKVD